MREDQAEEMLELLRRQDADRVERDERRTMNGRALAAIIAAVAVIGVLLLFAMQSSKF